MQSLLKGTIQASVTSRMFAGGETIMPDQIPLERLPDFVGSEFGVSDWLLIDQERVNKFAEATGDYQWIHVDVERATREMGGPIAHGYLTLSLIPYLSAGLHVTGVTRAIIYGANRVRFTNVVRVGQRVRLRQKLLSVECKSGGLQMNTEQTIEIEEQDRPACVAEMITILYDT
jgi:acyl dehydratase